MKSGNVDNVKRKIEQIRFGILKISGAPALSIPSSCMIETLQLTDDGYLWCTTHCPPSPKWLRAQGFRVKIKYIQKTEGLFIKLTGQAEVINNKLPGSHKDPIQELSDNKELKLLLKIRIEEAHCFQKKSISPYTSFLQSINNYTLNKVLLSRGA
jgi:hypothetical protein